ncbi:MAG: hypothetical protein AAB892_00135 [Patescibacteria group bacterium]
MQNLPRPLQKAIETAGINLRIVREHQLSALKKEEREKAVVVIYGGKGRNPFARATDPVQIPSFARGARGVIIASSPLPERKKKQDSHIQFYMQKCLRAQAKNILTWKF